MASPAKIVQALPDTLPEDFSEWDNGNPFEPSRAGSSGLEAGDNYEAAAQPQPAKAQAAREYPQPAKQQLQPAKPAAQPVKQSGQPVRQAGQPVRQQAQPTRQQAQSAKQQSQSARQSAQSGKQQMTIRPMVDGVRTTPLLTPASFYATAETRPMSFLSLNAESEDEKPASKKKLTIAVATVGSILLLLALIPILSPKRLAMTKKSIVPQPVAAESDASANGFKPSPATPLANGAEKPATATKPLPAGQFAADREQASTVAQDGAPAAVASTMMDDQLTAPTRIPHDIQAMPKKEAPPSPGFGGTSLDGLSNGGGNVMGSVFSNNNKAPKVQAATPTTVNITSGVAAGMLLQKTIPLYPAIAKSARVSGTVVLQATISKTGTIENLRVITGPAMLQQSALDAVRSWRYRPYQLNGTPVAVDTTVNVVFTSVGG